MGLGESEETLVLSAAGGGDDGVNANYAGSNNPDGRHFEISKTNLISNRTTVLLNSIPLSGIEQTITTQAFDSRYDYRLEPLTGRLELQRAAIKDQGGILAVPGASNVGNGFDLSGTSTLTLLDSNAPAETWTLRATSTILDAYGEPVSGNATFNVVGSVSGTILDAYGAPVTFKSDGVTRDNGILQAAMVEGAIPFERGDTFTIIVDSRVLARGDLLEARMIATQDIEDPEFFTDPNSLFTKHGTPSTTNTLSLGASMAFENGAFGVLALQAKPSLPRRTNETLIAADDPLTTDVEGLPPLTTPGSPAVADIDNFKFTLNGTPDTDTEVNIFVIDAADGVTETQIFPTKYSFYSSTIGTGNANQWDDFIDANTFSYTVILEDQVEDEGDDGVTTASSGSFSAATATFRTTNLDTGETDVGKSIRIKAFNKFGASVAAVSGTYTITAVGDGTGDATVVTVNTTFSDTVSNLQWELIDTADTSAKLLLTKDLETSGTIGTGDGIRVTYIDTLDADYFDANWAAAYDALEAAECQMVVPLSDQTMSAIQQAGRVHVGLMSSTANKKERVLLTGAQAGVSPEALLGTELVAVEDVGVLEGIQGDSAAEILAGNIEDLQDFNIATNFGGSFRTVYFWPDEIVRIVNGANTTIDGFYIAAAAAGRLAGTANVAIPLTRKVLIGFSILRTKVLKQATLDSLGGNGVTVVQPVTGGGIVLHGRTTTSSGAPEEEELSVIFIRDKVAQVMRGVLRRFIGKPEDPTLAAGIASAAVSALAALQAQNLITSFRNLNVVRDEVDPRQWNVILEVQPNFPVNWIFIDVSVGTL